MSTLTILCPNARRQQIKVQANTKVLDIIEEVCKKQALDANEYDLIFQKRTLDITLAFRLTGVPNNASLELKKLLEPRKFNDVTIVIQLDDGSRLAPKQFKPDSTLENLIEQHKDSNELMQLALNEEVATQTETYPVCIYLNEQIVGLFQIKNTTLKDLGLTNGRVIIRLTFRNLDKEVFEKLNQEFTQKLEKKLRLEKNFQKQLEKQREEEQRNREAAKIEPEKEDLTQSIVQVVQQKVEEQIKNEKKINFNTSKEQNYELHEKKKKIMQESTFNYESEQQNINEFANFKFPEETKGQKLNDFNELAEIERLSKEPCDRRAVLFNLNKKETESSASASCDTDELPENFFDITVNDLKYMLSELKKTQNEENLLMTKQMRELEQDKKAMKYSQVVARICFKDGTVLQGIFRPKELVSELYKFVSETLSKHQNTELDLDFTLFTTPPKIILSDKKKTLFEANLCPAAMIHFKNKSDNVPKFNQNIQFVDLSNANQLVNTQVHQTMREINHEGINWLQTENSLLQKAIKSTGFLKKH